MSEELLFGDLKVIDMSSWIAAPVAATMLADVAYQRCQLHLGDGQSQQALYRPELENRPRPESAAADGGGE